MVGRIKIVFCSLLFALNVAGQEVTPSDSTAVDSVQAKPTLMDRLHQLQQFLDDKAKGKVDPQYIEVPDKPWRVILRYKVNAVDVDYSDVFSSPVSSKMTEWNLNFNPPVASSIGFWVGYRGTGVSYSKSIASNAGRYFSFSTTGANYGFNFRLRRFSNDDARFTAAEYKNGKTGEALIDTTGLVMSPIWIRSVYINGYYVFNGRRYSQAAAYNQSVIQRHSSGSFLLGATWYQSSFDYSDLSNALFMMMGHGVHRIKVHQANIGFGYGYNLVPFRGLVINVMAMPTISVYDRVKVDKYDFNYEFAPVDPVDDYGEWNHETKTWANGKSHKSILMANENGADAKYWDMPSEIDYSMFHFNLDLRLGIAYNWKNWFVGAQAQFNSFHYKKDNNKVNISDGYARIALGVRL